MSDPHYANVSLLLPMSGVNNGTSFPDYSPVPKTVTRFGDTKTVTAESKFYGSSAYFDGADDYLTVPDSADLQLSGDFCVEFWVFFTTISNYHTVISKGYVGSGALLFQTWLNNGRFIIYAGGSAIITESGVATAGEWIHYALTRSGTSIKLFRDGVESGAATSSFNFNSTSALCVGSRFPRTTPNYEFNGYIQDFRITKGVARYTENFTPPTSLYVPLVFTGTVRDKTGALAARTVTALRESDQTVVATTTSDPITGEYEIITPHDEAHTLIFSGEVDRNAIVYSGVVPE